METYRNVNGSRIKKRKADCQDELHNERLTKRLSLLNLERSAQEATRFFSSSHLSPSPESNDSTTGGKHLGEAKTPRQRPSYTRSDDTMHVDDTAYKVYVHNLDDELSDSESSADESKVTFHPDLKRRLLATRIPDSVKADANGYLTGVNMSNELVLYDVPQSLTTSGENDNVRKAIIESRARAREAQRRERETFRTAPVDLLHMSQALQTSGQSHPAAFVDLTRSGIEPDYDAMDID